MDDCCEVCDNYIKQKSKYKRFKSKIHKEFDKCEHINLTFENPNINEVDSIFFSFFTEQSKKIVYFFKKCQSKSPFVDYQYYLYITSEL